MKKLKFYIFLILWGCGAPLCLAVTNINFSGELDLLLALKHLPTRDQGVTSISVPRLNLDIEVPLREENEVFLTLESAEFRDNKSKRFDTQLKNAYLSLTSMLPPQSTLRYGLIPDFYIELQREEWAYDFWGGKSDLPLIKYKYTHWSDLGFMYRGELPQDWGQWALSITNGEGYVQDEQGPGKQFQLLVGLTKMAPFYVTLAYTYGTYEDYASSFNKKIRSVLRLSYEFEKAFLSLEYFQTKDPAEAFANEMAAKVDVTDYLGTSLEGQGASLLGSYEISDQSELFLRWDVLSPVKQEARKNLKACSLGVSYDSSEDLRWALAFEYTDYSDEYSVTLRDESQLVLATRVSF